MIARNSTDPEKFRDQKEADPNETQEIQRQREEQRRREEQERQRRDDSAPEMEIVTPRPVFPESLPS